MEFLSNIFVSLGIFADAIVSTYTICTISKMLSKNRKSVEIQNIFYLSFCIFVIYLFNHITFNIYQDLLYMKWVISITFIPIFTCYFFKANYLTSIFSLICGMLVAAISELSFCLILKLLGINIPTVWQNLNTKVLVALFIKIFELCIMYSIYALYSKKHRIQSENSIVRYLVPQFIALSICLFPIMASIIDKDFNIPISFLIMNLCQLLTISFVSLYNIYNAIKQKDTETKLENTIIHNETLLKVNEGVRGFKHDMSNIVQAIIGYMTIGDIEGAKNFCQNLVSGFNDINILSILSPEIINDPAIYGVVVNKILVAREKEMSLSLDVNIDVADINFPKFEFARILGILIDNAIEAGENTKEKKLILDMHTNYNESIDIIKIANSIENLDIDTNKIFEQDYSTKENPSGYGLYAVKRYLNKYTQGKIVTTIDKDKKLFYQTISIGKIQEYEKVS